MNRYEFQLQFLAFVIVLECSLSACVCSKTSLPDPDYIFRNTVPSERLIGMNSQPHLFRLSLIPLSRKAFRSTTSGMGRASTFSLKGHDAACTGWLPPLHYCDKYHQASIPGCRIYPVALDCAHHMRINPTWCVLITLVSLYCHFILRQTCITNPVG